MSSFALKWIAIVSMLIDHIGATLIPINTPFYYACRAIGRLAFPLFAFMLSEGFFYTKNPQKYLLRLCIFAVASEIPFDLMISGSLLNWNHQNVFVTLALALMGLYYYDEFARRDNRHAALLTLLATAAASILTRSDYGAFGILMIFIFYRFRGERRSMAIWFSVCVVLYTLAVSIDTLPSITGLRFALITLFELFALIPIIFYSREKGYASRGWKYFFYIFYPAHMTALCLLREYLSM